MASDVADARSDLCCWTQSCCSSCRILTCMASSEFIIRLCNFSSMASMRRPRLAISSTTSCAPLCLSPHRSCPEAGTLRSCTRRSKCRRCCCTQRRSTSAWRFSSAIIAVSRISTPATAPRNPAAGVRPRGVVLGDGVLILNSMPPAGRAPTSCTVGAGGRPRRGEPRARLGLGGRELDGISKDSPGGRSSSTFMHNLHSSTCKQHQRGLGSNDLSQT
mmetsp:Transcript_35374/g.110291  ORF Transcript_35374/g.110291 Transcript_35374/m.110291 type:complete len:218 (+) Transcript_35374:1285-1938(+)